MSSSDVDIEDLSSDTAEDLLDRPALAAFLQKLVKLDLRVFKSEAAAFLLDDDLPELELELLSSS